MMSRAVDPPLNSARPQAPPPPPPAPERLPRTCDFDQQVDKRVGHGGGIRQSGDCPSRHMGIAAANGCTCGVEVSPNNAGSHQHKPAPSVPKESFCRSTREAPRPRTPEAAQGRRNSGGESVAAGLCDLWGIREIAVYCPWRPLPLRTGVHSPCARAATPPAHGRPLPLRTGVHSPCARASTPPAHGRPLPLRTGGHSPCARAATPPVPHGNRPAFHGTPRPALPR